MEHIDNIYSEPKAKFAVHLLEKGNCRVVFSGIYGIGKTYFLKRFFEEEKGEYETFWLKPVNYSVSLTEDVFQYIKYDILGQLLLKDVTFDSLDLKNEHYLYLYLSKHWEKVAAGIGTGVLNVFKELPGVGKMLEALVEFVKKGKGHFDEFKSELKLAESESDLIEAFMNRMEQEGSVYEDSFVMRLLNQKVQLLKTKGADNKETVLIIDDLDRIDPEHIFRILNVFAAHLDDMEFEEPALAAGRNKFSFDKIILVCDIANIRNIFHSRYGGDVDFSGYIDKFYSREVFYFDIRNLLRPLVREIAGELIVESSRSDEHVLGRREDLELYYLIEKLFRKNAISLRNFLKFRKHDEVQRFPEKAVFRANLSPAHTSLWWQLIILRRMLGDRATVLLALSKLELADFVSDEFPLDSFFKNLLVLASAAQHGFVKREVVYELDNNTVFRIRMSEGSRVESVRHFREFPGEEGEPLLEYEEFYDYIIPLLNKCIRTLIANEML